jgi:LPXTG-motif cell wall-anchored protein
MIFTKKASIRMRKIVVAGTLVFGLTVFTVTKSSFAKSLLDGGNSSGSVESSYSVTNNDSVTLVKVDNTKHYEQPKTDEVPKAPEGGPIQVQSTSMGNLPQTSDGVNRALPIIGASLIVGSFGLLVTRKKYDLL